MTAPTDIEARLLPLLNALPGVSAVSARPAGADGVPQGEAQMLVALHGAEYFLIAVPARRPGMAA